MDYSQDPSAPSVSGTVTATPELQPIRYVVYQDDGALIGCFLQVPPADHAGHLIVVDEATAAEWVNYRANDARDGLELVPPAPPAPSPIPQQVTMRQARLALLGAGKLDQVDAAIDALPDDQKGVARIEWDYSSAVERGWPLVAALGQSLGLDDQALDQLFITAAGL